MAVASGLIAPARKQNSLKLSTFENIQTLIEQAKRMGLTPDIKDLVDEVEELNLLIQKKNYELVILESVAMESDDENITDLRNQLFVAVKLIHSEDINELMNDANLLNRVFGSNRRYAPESTYDEGVNKKASLFSRLRESFSKRRELKEEINRVKENFHRQQRHISESEDCCEGG